MQLNSCTISRSLTRFLLVPGLFAGLALAATSSPAQYGNNPNADPPSGAARLTHLDGNVSIQANGEDQWGQAQDNQPVGAGDRFYTDQQARGELQTGRVRAYLSSNTDLTLVNQNDQGLELGVAQGTVHIYSDGFEQGRSLFVSTPNGGITLVGRGEFRLEVYPDQQSTVITNGQNGEQLQLNGAGNFNMYLDREQSIQLSGTNPVYSQYLQPPAIDEFAHWSGGIESHRFNSRSARYVSPEMVGYDDLDDNGDWQPESDYGPIWFPHVEQGWAPYHNGHWVNRPYYGWTWVEDEPWGSAPFHYGRWVQMRGRWGWIPGPREVRPVWSPAQVVFAGGIHIGGAGISVWFPLGPGEAYHPWYNSSPEYVNRINQTNIRETKIVHIQNTYVNNTVVNNTTINNITYVNRGAATAVKQEDFASGRNVRAVAVKVDPQQVQHVVVARPEAPLPAKPIIVKPVAKPVAVQAARPVLINNKGEQAQAAPNARPVVVPVKTTPPAPIKALPGRAPISAPAVGVKPATPPAGTNNRPTPVAAPNPAANPNTNINKATPVQPTPDRPAPTPVTPTTPAAPVRPNSGVPAVPGRPTPPAATPVVPTAPKETTPAVPARPVPPARTQPTVPPDARPIPPAQRPAAPDARPIPPATRPVPPDSRPTPPPTRPAPQDMRPAQPQTPPQPQARPTPEGRPAPSQRPAPTPKDAKPNKDEKRDPPKKPE